MWAEFKAFAIRGNLIELAVAFVMGGIHCGRDVLRQRHPDAAGGGSVWQSGFFGTVVYTERQ
ncbi:hypothetical protein BH24CHL1_BH24CHL1_16680 [soil metagenome]